MLINLILVLLQGCQLSSLFLWSNVCMTPTPGHQPTALKPTFSDISLWTSAPDTQHCYFLVTFLLTGFHSLILLSKLPSLFLYELFYKNSIGVGSEDLRC